MANNYLGLKQQFKLLYAVYNFKLLADVLAQHSQANEAG